MTEGARGWEAAKEAAFHAWAAEHHVPGLTAESTLARTVWGPAYDAGQAAVLTKVEAIFNDVLRGAKDCESRRDLIDVRRMVSALRAPQP